MTNRYFKNSMVRAKGLFFDGSDVPSDPTSVTVKVQKPDGTETTYVYLVSGAVVKDAVGQYHIDILGDQVGLWYYRWEATGVVQATQERYFKVERSEFAT